MWILWSCYSRIGETTGDCVSRFVRHPSHCTWPTGASTGMEPHYDRGGQRIDRSRVPAHNRSAASCGSAHCGCCGRSARGGISGDRSSRDGRIDRRRSSPSSAANAGAAGNSRCDSPRDCRHVAGITGQGDRNHVRNTRSRACSWRTGYRISRGWSIEQLKAGWLIII